MRFTLFLFYRGGGEDFCHKAARAAGAGSKARRIVKQAGRGARRTQSRGKIFALKERPLPALRQEARRSLLCQVYMLSSS